MQTKFIKISCANHGKELSINEPSKKKNNKKKKKRKGSKIKRLDYGQRVNNTKKEKLDKVIMSSSTCRYPL